MTDQNNDPIVVPVEFTVEEVNAAMNLVDLAVRANGVAVAQAAHHIFNKLQTALIVATTPKAPA